MGEGWAKVRRRAEPQPGQVLQLVLAHSGQSNPWPSLMTCPSQGAFDRP